MNMLAAKMDDIIQACSAARRKVSAPVATETFRSPAKPPTSAPEPAKKGKQDCGSCSGVGSVIVRYTSEERKEKPFLPMMRSVPCAWRVMSGEVLFPELRCSGCGGVRLPYQRRSRLRQPRPGAGVS